MGNYVNTSNKDVYQVFFQVLMECMIKGGDDIVEQMIWLWKRERGIDWLKKMLHRQLKLQG